MSFQKEAKNGQKNARYGNLIAHTCVKEQLANVTALKKSFNINGKLNALFRG